MVETKSLTSTTSGLNIDGTAIHPITCCQQRLSYDKFHQGNSKNPTTLMRRTGRFLIAERNNRKNEKMRHELETKLFLNCPLVMDMFGRLVFSPMALPSPALTNGVHSLDDSQNLHHTSPMS